MTTRQPAHQQTACHCSYDHAPEDGCYWAKWDEDSYVIQRCHRPRIEGGNVCLLHHVVNITMAN